MASYFSSTLNSRNLKEVMPSTYTIYANLDLWAENNPPSSIPPDIISTSDIVLVKATVKISLLELTIPTVKDRERVLHTSLRYLPWRAISRCHLCIRQSIRYVLLESSSFYTQTTEEVTL